MITGLIGLLLIVFIWGFAIASSVFWIWMLVHAITNKGLDSIEKLIWVVVILCLHFIGGLIYFFYRPPQSSRSIQLIYKHRRKGPNNDEHARRKYQCWNCDRLKIN